MKKSRVLISPILTLLCLGLAFIYLSARVKFFLGIESGWWLYLIISILPFLLFTGLFRMSNSSSAFGSLVYRSSAFSISFILYFLFSVIMIDLAGLIIEISPGLMGILSVSLTAIFVTGGYLNSFRIKITRHRIEMPDFKEEMRIAHLSDIHIGHFRGKKFLEQIVDKTS